MSQPQRRPAFLPDRMDDASAARWLAAHRSVLDHVLALIADNPWGEGLILRGSMAMLAHVGDHAREPADLDFIMSGPLAFPVDPLDPYPYVDSVEAAQQWPEALGGAARYDIYGEEEFDTHGIRAVVAPEGLRWVLDEDPTPPAPVEELTAALRGQALTSIGVTIDAAGIRHDAEWGYAGDGDDVDSDVPDTSVRIHIPWRADGVGQGVAQIDISGDETLPTAPEFAAVPRVDSTTPTAVRVATAASSLAWKLLWMRDDVRGLGCADGKDLYDAVLLAECPAVTADPVGTRRVLRRVLHTMDHPWDSAAVTTWTVDWDDLPHQYPHITGVADDWLKRLAAAVEHLSG